MNRYLSIDIGGTSIKSGLVGDDGTLCAQKKVPSCTNWPELMSYITAEFHRVGGCDTMAGVALSAPGIVDGVSGVIHGLSAPSVSYIMGPSFYCLREALGVPVHLEQDANCAVLGEYWQGNAQGCHSAVALVMGSGLGGGILLDGRILRGAHGQGGDVGYIHLSPQTGEPRLSTQLSPVAVAAAYAQETGRALTLSQMRDTPNDPVASMLYSQWLTKLALLILSLQAIVDPEIFLLGGGISEWEPLVDDVRRKFTELADSQFIPHLPQVAVCRHRNSANLLGAVYALMQQLADGKTA